MSAERAATSKTYHTIMSRSLLFTGIAGLVVCCGFQVARAGAFFTRTDYAAVGPNDVAIGDLNGDGHQDIVAPCPNLDSLAVFLGNGDGTFQSRQDIATGTSPKHVTLADVNGDGKLDIAIIEEGVTSFAVMLGNGDGTFDPPTIPVSDSGTVFDLAIGDLNGDNHPDVVVTYFSPHGFKVFLGLGDGTFGGPMYHGTSNAADGGAALGDLDGDGHQDIVAASASHLTIYLGDGTGALTLSKFIEESVIPLKSVGISDLNGDQKLDIVGAKRGVDVWLGNGDATFGPLAHYAGPGTLKSQDMAIADFNGDGFKDLAVANPGNLDQIVGFSVFQGNGDGSFGARADFTTPVGPSQLASGDFDEDGRPDLAVACGAGNVSVFLNRTTVVDAHVGSRAYLAQSQPNPAFGQAQIRFSLGHPEDTSLSIYNVTGRLVRTLLRGQVTAGWHAASWDGRTSRGDRAPAGVYLYELRTGHGRDVKRMTLLRP